MERRNNSDLILLVKNKNSRAYPYIKIKSLTIFKYYDIMKGDIVKNEILGGNIF